VPAALFTAPQNAPSADGSDAGLRQQSKPGRGDALAEQTSEEAASQRLPGLAGENGKSGCKDGRRRWLEANADSCTQEKWFSGALRRQSSVSIPLLCYLLPQQLAHRCHSPGFCWAVCWPVWAVPDHWWLMRCYFLLWVCFCGGLPLRHDCNPVLFMPPQLLQAISLTFSRRV